MLEAAVAVLYFINKIFLSLNKKAGWQIGVLASLLALVYFFSLKLYLLVGLEASFLAILVYGWITHSKQAQNHGTLYILIGLAMVVLYFVLKNSTFLEFIISLLFILAIFFLAKKQWNLGWLHMLAGHVLMAYFTHQKGQNVFALMQVLSVFVSVFAIYKNYSVSKT